jgi:hypothetical protein
LSEPPQHLEKLVEELYRTMHAKLAHFKT